MRHLRSAGPYKLAFSPLAWRQVGTLSSAEFQVVQRVLTDEAERAGLLEQDDAQQRTRVARAGELMLVLEFEHQARQVTLQDVTRSLATS